MNNVDLTHLTADDIIALGVREQALRCKTDLFFLCKTVLGYNKMEVGTHQELCDYTTVALPNPPEIDRKGLDPRKNLLLLLMPRGTFKSSVVTIGFTLQFFLNEPNARVLIDSETYSKSKAFLREIIGHLENNQEYREIFKAIHGMYPYTKKSEMKLWTDSEIILPCRSVSKKEPSISCAGIDVTKNGMHYDLMIGDDLHSENNVTNKEQIQKVKDHYKLAFSLLDPGKPMIIIGTRWDYNDLYQHIIDFEGEDFNILQKSAYNDDGTLFFPEVLSEKELDKIRRRQGSYIFSCQYLNEPVSDENATFKREYLDRVKWEDVKGRPINWYLSIDPSYTDPRSTGLYSDYVGMVLVGMDYQRELYVKYITRRKMTYSETINEIFRIYTSNIVELKQIKIILEVIGTKSLSYELNNEQKRRNTWLPIQEIKSRHESKEERIRGLAPFYEYGHAHHIIDCPHLEELEYELLHFPRGSHDDIIDPYATVLEVASPPAAKQFERREDREHRALNYKPRSSITGY